jgi:hypothetical protein
LSREDPQKVDQMIVYVKCVTGVIVHKAWSDFGFALRFPIYGNVRILQLNCMLPDPLPINVSVEALH